MPSRYQFSLRALLVTTALACLMLGGWSLLKTYGQYIEAFPAKVGEPVVVRGRFIRLWGDGYYELTVWPIAGFNDEEFIGGSLCEAEGTWLFGYSVETVMMPFTRPCEFALELRPCGFMEDTARIKPIRGTLSVQASD